MSERQSAQRSMCSSQSLRAAGSSRPDTKATTSTSSRHVTARMVHSTGHALNANLSNNIDYIEAVKDLYARALAAWPDIRVPPSQFEELVAEKVAGSAQPAEHAAELCAPDLYLACACA